MNKISKVIINFSLFTFVILGIFLLGIKLNINKWITIIFVVIYITFILNKFKLVEEVGGK